METALKAWFGNVEVVREGTTPFDPADKYIFGYAPHGLFPIGVLAYPPFCHTVSMLLLRNHLLRHVQSVYRLICQIAGLTDASRISSAWSEVFLLICCHTET